MNKKWDHAVSLNFSVKSDNEVPTGEELLQALKEKVKDLEHERSDCLIDHFEIFDSEEIQ